MSHYHDKTHHHINILEDVSFGEGVDLAIGLTATALTADQLVKLAHTKKHTAEHVIKGGLSAGLAAAAFTMMAREHRENHDKRKEKEQRRRDFNHQRDRTFEDDDYSDGDRDGRTMALTYPRPFRRGSSTHSMNYHHYHDRSPSRPLNPPRRRAHSHSPPRDRSFADNHPNLIKFMEAVRDNLRDDRR